LETCGEIFINSILTKKENRKP